MPATKETPSLRVLFSGLAQALGLIALLLGHALKEPFWIDVCVGATIAATLLRWPDLARLPRIFLIGGIASFVFVEAVFPDQLSNLTKALQQGAAFSCLLASLGLLRHPVRRSGTIRAGASYLLSFPSRKRYAAVNAGCHFLSLLFNVGIIPLLGDLLGKKKVEASEKAHDQSLLLAAMRGAVLMTVWSPMGLGFAIVTTSIPALDPVVFVALAFTTAMLLMAVTCLTAKDANLSLPVRESAQPGLPPTPLVFVLMVCGGLLLAVIAVHHEFGWPFIAATVLVLPAFTAAWLTLENRGGNETLPETGRALLHCMGDMRAESAIFLSANVIGAALVLCIRNQAVWHGLQSSATPMLAVLMACLAIVPLAGALLIPHSIFVVLTAQLFGDSPLGQQHPLALGLALTLGWAMAIAVSPISAMALTTGKLCDTRSHVVGFHWNRRFVATLFCLSALLVTGLYSAGL